MVEQDNSIQFITANKDPKPTKVRKFKTLLLHGFDGNADHHTITSAIKGTKPEFLNRKRVTITVGVSDCELDFTSLIKMFHGRNIIPVIKTEAHSDLSEAYQCLNIAKSMCNYLLRDPDNLEIPLIVFDFAQTPEACKFMIDFMVSHHSESLVKIKQNQMEITRVKNGPSGRIIDIPVKINLR